jgi:hypothetical protein
MNRRFVIFLLLASLLALGGCKATSACAKFFLDAVLSPSDEEEQRIEERRRSAEIQYFNQKIEEEAMAH